MEKALVSIIIPTRDRSELLRRCLGCLKNQTYPNIEIIVVDGNSKLNDVRIAKEYTDKVFVFDKEGDHRCAQRNMGAEKASGKYVLIIDSDMELTPRVVESCVEKIEKNENVKGIIIPECSIGEGFWAKCKALEKSFYVGVDWMEAARFFYREDFLKVGGYNVEMTSGEDWDLSQRIGDLGTIERTDEFLDHNEGRINLWKTMKKKYYYAGEFAKYANSSKHQEKVGNQTGIFLRYKLFLSQPRKLFRHPLVGLGMIFMKTCEFGFGALGYIRKYKKVREDSYKILLIGTHGQNNIGDELLLETFLFQLRRFVNKQVLDFFVNSYQPEVTEAVFNVKSFHTLKEKYKLLFYILRCDCIFFAGGSIVKELYSAYGRNKYSVLNILVFLVGFSKIIMRKKIILSNIGIGPLETKKGLRKAKFVLSHSDFVSVRDLESIKYGRMVGIDKLILVPDAVLSLDKNYFKLVDINDRKINSLMDVHKIGFNLCRNISKPAVWNNFIIEMMNFFEILFNYNPDIEIIGLPMQQNYSCDDYKTLNEFQIQLKKRLPRIKIKILRPKEAKEVAKIINDCDLMIVERLHGAVLSTIIHVPFISLEYDVKVKSYLAEIDFKDNGVDISESFDAREVFGKVKTVAENYSKQVCKLKSVSSEKKFLADKYFIQLREDLYS